MSALAGLTLLIIGDSHYVTQGYLVTTLHDQLQRQGARVITYGACGVASGAWVSPRTVPCGVAERVGNAAPRINRSPQARSWSIDALIRKHRPNIVIVGVGDPMAGYQNRELPRGWITEQVRSLTLRFQANQMPCVWVGPSWGSEGGPYFKNFARVREVADYLATQVSPCQFIDSTSMARPGEWPTFDGQHHTLPAYQRWGAAITQQIVASPVVRQVQASLPRR
jgi:hypothetical protein